MAYSKSMLPFIKKRSQSRDLERNEAWLRRKSLRHSHLGGRLVSRSIMDEDLDELRGCIDLGFGFAFNSGSIAGLAKAFSAVGPYHAIHKLYHNFVVEFGSSIDGSLPESPPLHYLPRCKPRTSEEKVKAVGPSGCMLGASRLLNFYEQKKRRRRRRRRRTRRRRGGEGR